MSANVGQIDRLLRLVLGLALLAAPLLGGLAIFGAPALGYAALAVGAILTLTASIKFCPLYRLIGVCTTERS